MIKSGSRCCKVASRGHYLESHKDTRPQTVCRRRRHKYASKVCIDLGRSRTELKKKCQCCHVYCDNVCKCLLNSEKHEVPCNHDKKNHTVKFRETPSPVFFTCLNISSKGTQFSLTFERNTQTLNKLEKDSKVDKVDENVRESAVNQAKISCIRNYSGDKDQTSLNEQNTILNINIKNNISATKELSENKLQVTEIKSQSTTEGAERKSKTEILLMENKKHSKISSENHIPDRVQEAEYQNKTKNLSERKSIGNNVTLNISQSVILTDKETENNTDIHSLNTESSESYENKISTENYSLNKTLSTKIQSQILDKSEKDVTQTKVPLNISENKISTETHSQNEDNLKDETFSTEIYNKHSRSDVKTLQLTDNSTSNTQDLRDQDDISESRLKEDFQISQKTEKSLGKRKCCILI